MPKPQQASPAWSPKEPTQDPDTTETALEAVLENAESDPGGPVPPENVAGHRPPADQDKPDPDRFAERFGIRDPSDTTPDAP
jgi:hypothetical protein